MPYQGSALPTRDALVDERRHASQVFIDWATQLQEDVDAAPARLSPVELTDQGAAIGLTAIPVGALSAGLYRLTYRMRVSRPATTSSSFTFSFTFTDRTQTVTVTDSAVTGNTVQTFTSRSWLIRIDASSPVSYAAAYASVGATSMLFDLDVVLEQVNA